LYDLLIVSIYLSIMGGNSDGKGKTDNKLTPGEFWANTLASHGHVSLQSEFT